MGPFPMIILVGSRSPIWLWWARSAASFTEGSPRGRAAGELLPRMRQVSFHGSSRYTRRTFSQSIFRCTAGSMPRNCSSMAFGENGQVPSRCG